MFFFFFFFFFQAEDGIRDRDVTGVQTCALPISRPRSGSERRAQGGSMTLSYYGGMDRDRARRVAGPPERPGLGPGPAVRPGPVLRRRHHRAHGGHPATATPPRDQADPFDAGDGPPPAKGQGHPAEAPGEPGQTERGAPEALPRTQRQSAGRLPADDPPAAGADRPLLRAAVPAERRRPPRVGPRRAEQPHPGLEPALRL